MAKLYSGNDLLVTSVLIPAIFNSGSTFSEYICVASFLWLWGFRNIFNDLGLFEKPKKQA